MKFKASTLHKIGRPLVNYVYKNPKKNIPKVLKIGKAVTGNLFPETTWTAPLDVITNPQNTWNDYVYRIIEETDKELLTNVLLTFAIDAGYIGTSTLRENRDKLKCNIPWIILMDPTSACNLKCKGCWAAEYGHHSNLTLDEMRKIVTEAKALGTHFFMFTGGEPLVRKKDILTVTKENPDCIFLAFTNGTLVDDEFCEELKKSGNFALALSIEGTEETTDFRRGEGVYKKVVDAMALLKKHKCIFGTSICYTSKNYQAVTSDKFYDMEIEAGAKFALYFHYMPIGSDADTSLLLTPEQREHVYRTIRKKRRTRNGKPIFVMDFQNDGEFVGGCIAGGRNYFHINSEGDAEPCVFIHYSDSNIREKSILECLRSPLFKQYYKGQPFNDNMLRPCPMLENPQALRHIIDVTGAKSTNLTCPESADELCSKCDLYAKEWAPMAKQIWEEQERFHPFTQYYRDTDEAKNEQ
ncbi:radical SAM protein [Eubacterium coprostanoligenes]|uniref:Radical SAM superfamily enzyme, MoaA/NifB/PqqE/SkfB family n=1 Tax=Eubacterium coprostanoligenes TaxID=290054 RepID=A0A1T4K106_9FIRM|nr:radical SAM protein [Eubacterium coprostanoligenes]MDD6666245.1 radical SAM protein [Eubacterium coprostanoligenes]MDD7358199.1 radical SAM protein [Eubacterium coprostanoligenes]SJZ36166.1 Radical SAM superfamily enzyme, MoaA/NifB/PqqE/SkfB family [Eubacterium coprostanoligenes]